MKTIKEEVSEVYKTSNNNSSFNKNIYNFNSKLNKNVNGLFSPNNTIQATNNRANKLTPPSIPLTSSSNMILYVFVALLGVIIVSVIVFKDKIIEMIKPFFLDDEDEKEKEDAKKEMESQITEKEEKNIALEEEVKTLKSSLEKEVKTETKDKEAKVEKRENPLKQQYSASQIMKEDGYCYIGTDDNMRHCANAYTGDICTSGDKYRRIDDCLIPKSGEQGCLNRWIKRNIWIVP